MNKLKKSKVIELYQKIVDSKVSTLFIRNLGIKVNQLNAVRSELMTCQGKCMIIKNNLFRIASSKIDDMSTRLNQSLLIIYGKEYVSIFKTAIALCQKYPLKVLFGTIDNEIINTSKIKAISELQTEYEIHTRIVYLMRNIQSKILNTLEYPCSRIVRVVQEYDKIIKK